MRRIGIEMQDWQDLDRVLGYLGCLGREPCFLISRPQGSTARMPCREIMDSPALRLPPHLHVVQGPPGASSSLHVLFNLTYLRYAT
jgi:hypothetical protein